MFECASRDSCSGGRSSSNKEAMEIPAGLQAAINERFTKMEASVENRLKLFEDKLSMATKVADIPGLVARMDVMQFVSDPSERGSLQQRLEEGVAAFRMAALDVPPDHGKLERRVAALEMQFQVLKKTSAEGDEELKELKEEKTKTNPLNLELAESQKFQAQVSDSPPNSARAGDSVKFATPQLLEPADDSPIQLTFKKERRDPSDPAGMGYSAMSHEQEVTEYKAIVQNATEELLFRQTVYDAAVFVLVKDFPHIEMADLSTEVWSRVFAVSFCLIVNMILQVMFIYWILEYLVRPKTRHLQENYKEFRSVAFYKGEFDLEGFKSLGDKRYELCSMAMSTEWFMHSMIFIWAASCLDEARDGYRTFRGIIRGLPTLPSGIASIHQIYIRPGEHTESIICVTRCTRVVLLSIFIPRMIIWVGLIMVGTAFLYCTEHDGDLILNSCALLFVLNIDELMFRVFLPLRLRKILQNVRVRYPYNDLFLRWTGLNIRLSDMQRAYAHNAMFVSGAWMFVFLWYYMQPILPGYDWDVTEHCGFADYLKEPICKFMDYNCFPKS